MAVKVISLAQVICDDCGKSIMLESWRDAAKLGWAVPNDGAFQKCNVCIVKYKEKIFREAKLAEIADKRPLEIDKGALSRPAEGMCNGQKHE